MDDELEQQLRQLAKVTCRCVQDSRERKKYLDQMIWQLLRSGKLWRGTGVPKDAYDDILQRTWIYLCCNLCEAKTAHSAFDPNRASVITWINAYIRMRVLDYHLAIEREKRLRVFSQESESGDIIDPVDMLPSPKEPPPIVEELMAWVECESSSLRRIHVRDRPDINCKELILRQLPPATSWKNLAQEFSVSEYTLQGFYQRECLPRLLDAGRRLGYLNT